MFSLFQNIREFQKFFYPNYFISLLIQVTSFNYFNIRFMYFIFLQRKLQKSFLLSFIPIFIQLTKQIYPNSFSFKISNLENLYVIYLFVQIEIDIKKILHLILIIKLLKNHEKDPYRTYHYLYPRQSNQTTNSNNKNPIIPQNC